MSAPQFGEPWKVSDDGFIRDADGFAVMGSGIMIPDHRVRIVACVSAMAGIPDPAALMAAHRELVEAAKPMTAWLPDEEQSNRLRDALAAMTAERDSLLHIIQQQKDRSMKGFRKDNPEQVLPTRGQYGRGGQGEWFGMTPNGVLANLSGHTVTEHADGTITVSPSILVSTTKGKELWHGHLTSGEWIPCSPWEDKPCP